MWAVSEALTGMLSQLAAFPALCAVFREPRYLQLNAPRLTAADCHSTTAKADGMLTADAD